MSIIVGLSAFFHDAACCVLRDGVLVAAAQEERFSRQKHDASFPLQAFRWCLAHAGLTLGDVDCVAYYEQPWRKLERQLWQRGADLSADGCLQLWDAARRPVDAIRHLLGHEGDVELCGHHHAHAASAFLFSGVSEAAILTVDGVGEWATTTYGHGCGTGIDLFEEVAFPHSLGLLYSTLTSYLGFSVNDGEYKVMGLAPYGQPRHIGQMAQLIESAEGGQFRLNPQYFDFTRPDRMYTDALRDLLDVPPRQPGGPLDQGHRDLARSLQLLLEELLLEKVRYLHTRVPVPHLCMAGGVALNCVANGRIHREGPFRHLFVQPAAGDAGGALGAAALASVRRWPHRAVRRLDHVYLGPAYSARSVADLLGSLGIAATDYRGNEPALLRATADLLAAGRIIGWFQGRMEFGPRALGARSILADPRDAAMRDRVNGLIKEREAFRPFAPAVVDAFASQYFALDYPSPFMLEACPVKATLPLPAVTHVDGTARVQTVDAWSHPRMAALLRAFHARTGCPILLNTSFNLRDEPIVESPQDALLSFARSRLDALVLEDFIIERTQLTAALPAASQRLASAMTRLAATQVYTF